MWSKEDLVWKTVIMNWTWDQFKSMVIRVFGQGWDHFSTHIDTVDKAGKLTWMCIIPNHRTYGKNSKYSVSSNSEFQRFMGAVLDNPTSQVIICVLMADPSMVAKKLERVSMFLGPSSPLLISDLLMLGLISSICRKRPRTRAWPSTMATKRSAVCWC
jgi:hypothetical protein